ncbi:MAG: hypothetical protein E7Z62_01775 [Thermoplasmata archaeon]|nr:hypothetical protein [Thermoplasmata archaeon]
MTSVSGSIVLLKPYVVADNIRNKSDDEIPVYSVTRDRGFCTSFFDKDMSSDDKTTYKIVPRGHFAYNPLRANVGSLGYQNVMDRVLVSSRYVVFKLTGDEIYPEYLELLLKSDLYLQIIDAICRGSVRPELTIYLLQKIPIRLYSVDIQKKFVENINKITDMIERYDTLIGLYDELIKSKFNELFGDPFFFPKYSPKPFMECMVFNPSKSEINHLDDEILVSFVPMENIGSNGVISLNDVKQLGEVREGYSYFRDGDVIFAKITPSFENGKVAIADGCTNGLAFGTTEIHVSRPIPGVSNAVWLKYLLKSDTLRQLASNKMKGTAGQQRIQQSFFEKLSIGLPPIPIQESFAAFVQQIEKMKNDVINQRNNLIQLSKSIQQEYFSLKKG